LRRGQALKRCAPVGAEVLRIPRLASVEVLLGVVEDQPDPHAPEHHVEVAIPVDVAERDGDVFAACLPPAEGMRFEDAVADVSQHLWRRAAAVRDHEVYQTVAVQIACGHRRRADVEAGRVLPGIRERGKTGAARLQEHLDILLQERHAADDHVEHPVAAKGDEGDGRRVACGAPHEAGAAHQVRAVVVPQLVPVRRVGNAAAPISVDASPNVPLEHVEIAITIHISDCDGDGGTASGTRLLEALIRPVPCARSVHALVD